MPNSTVSIIIPCYNQAQYLTDAIESCLAQTHKDCQIIVVDDGSTDATRETVMRFPQVTYLRQPNRGQASARNLGWQSSQSRYLQFLDADDILLPTKIERCVEVLDSDPTLDLVYTDFSDRAADLQPLKARAPHIAPGHIFSLELLLKKHITYFPPHSPLIRYEMVEQVGGFNEALQGTEDWYFWVSLAAHGAKARYIDEVLVWYRHRSDSFSRQSLPMMYARLAAYEQLRLLPVPLGLIDLPEKLAQRHYALALELWLNRKHAEARKHFVLATRFNARKRGASWMMIMLSYILNVQTAVKLMSLFLRVKNKGRSPETRLQ
jgi:glycosyltransferase involved in cell wall biosynthesis